MNDIQTKSIIDQLVQKLMSFLNLNSLQALVNKEISKYYDKGMQDVEVKFDMNFKVDPRKMNQIADYTFDNIKGMNEEIANDLRQQLQQALINQESIAQIKQRVKKVMDVADARASAIARTETQRAENFGALDGAKQAPVEMKKYLLIAHDKRTSCICEEMGKKYGSPDQAIALDKDFKVTVDGNLIKAPAPPFHVNCRTAVAFVQVQKK